jgi:hypothetical protein
VLHALRSVLGTVSTKGIAGCFALLLVRGYLAMYDTRDPWLVDTNVQVFVGRSAEGYCQLCSKKQENRVDLLEMKTYGEISLKETPIVVLGCGHFFTAASLDGMVECQPYTSATQMGTSLD